jgi:hypothetical protein
MQNQQAEDAYEEILAVEVSDEALEKAATGGALSPFANIGSTCGWCPSVEFCR